MNRVPSYEEVQQIQSAADVAGRQNWFGAIVFTYQWWILVGLTIIPYITWWKFVDRKRFFEILTYGLLVCLVAGLLDAIGVETDAWDYKYDLVPLLDVFIVYDVSVLPVTYMAVYQYCQTWRSFAIASMIVAFVFSFIFEPLLIWLDIYHPASWKHIYSFPGYFMLTVLLRWVMDLLKRKSLA